MIWTNEAREGIVYLRGLNPSDRDEPTGVEARMNGRWSERLVADGGRVFRVERPSLSVIMSTEME